MKEGGGLYSKVLNDAAHFIVIADKEKLQGAGVFTKKEAQL